jgi:hypothetical protein
MHNLMWGADKQQGIKRLRLTGGPEINVSNRITIASRFHLEKASGCSEGKQRERQFGS